MNQRQLVVINWPNNEKVWHWKAARHNGQEVFIQVKRKVRNKNAEIVYIAFWTTINLIIVIFCHSLGILGCRGKKQKEVGLLLFRLGFSKTFYLYKAQGWVGSQLCLIDFKSSIQCIDSSSRTTFSCTRFVMYNLGMLSLNGIWNE